MTQKLVSGLIMSAMYILGVFELIGDNFDESLVWFAQAIFWMVSLIYLEITDEKDPTD